MATLSATYGFDHGRLTPAAASNGDGSAAILWTFVHQLTGQLNGLTQGVWEVLGSSNGYGSAGAGGTCGSSPTWGLDGVNRWWNGGTFNPAILVSTTGYPANAGAWILLQAPASLTGRPKLLIARSQSIWSTVDWRIYVTNGTLPNPTAQWYAPDHTYVTGGVMALTSFNSYNFITHLAEGTSDLVQRRCHLSLATDGAFFWMCNKSGNSREMNGLMMGKLVGGHPDDQQPWAFLHSCPKTNDDVHNWPTAGYTTGSTSAWSLAKFYGLSNWNYAGCGLGGIGTYGSPGVNMQPIVPVAQVFGTGMAEGNTCIALRAFGSPGRDAIRQTWPEIPVQVIDSSPSFRGTIRDLYQSYQVPGTVDPSGEGPITRVTWGNFWIPSPNALPVL